MSERGGNGYSHEPVMLKEVLELLAPTPGKRFLDLTLGGGGHTEALLERVGSGGQVVTVDRDEEVLLGTSARLRQRFGNVRFFSADFGQLEELSEELEGARFDGVLMDVGVSSLQLDDAGRGFSFQKDGPLDMRMDRTQTVTAAHLLNHLPEEELARILREYGEERKASRLAREIVKARAEKPLQWTAELVAICERVVGKGKQRIHPATRTFQGLRIAVNAELKALESAMETMPKMLESGGVVVVLSYHSLEDRIVKRYFRSGADQGLYQVLTRKPLRPTPEEVERNRRVRSARLRAARRTGQPGENIRSGGEP